MDFVGISTHPSTKEEAERRVELGHLNSYFLFLFFILWNIRILSDMVRRSNLPWVTGSESTAWISQVDKHLMVSPMCSVPLTGTITCTPTMITKHCWRSAHSTKTPAQVFHSTESQCLLFYATAALAINQPPPREQVTGSRDLPEGRREAPAMRSHSSHGVIFGWQTDTKPRRAANGVLYSDLQVSWFETTPLTTPPGPTCKSRWWAKTDSLKSVWTRISAGMREKLLLRISQKQICLYI